MPNGTSFFTTNAGNPQSAPFYDATCSNSDKQFTRISGSPRIFFRNFAPPFPEYEMKKWERQRKSDLRQALRVRAHAKAPAFPQSPQTLFSVHPSIVGRLCQPRMFSGFTEWSRGDASDIDGRARGRVSGSKRVKRATKTTWSIRPNQFPSPEPSQ